MRVQDKQILKALDLLHQQVTASRRENRRLRLLVCTLAGIVTTLILLELFLHG